MRAVIVESLFGILAFDEENRLLDNVLFSKNPQRTAEVLSKIESGKVVDELAELVNKLKGKGCETFVFENANLAEEAQKTLKIKVEVFKPSRAGEVLRSNMARFAVETGFAQNSNDFSLWVHKVTMEMAKLRVKLAVEKRDLLVAQAIQAVDDLDKTLNLFMSRIREWYGIHFPELDRLLDKHETYACLVLELGSRENFTIEKLEAYDIPKAKAEQIAQTAEKSMGADIAQIDLTQIQLLCKNVISLYQLRQTLEEYLDKTMDEVAPNVKALVGALLGARLIALSGGLTNLAKMPASTIQVLGAEKALFRSLKTGAKPPKHGIIFQHAYLHEAKKWHRGKIARALAGKLAIAARIDAFGGRQIGEELKAEIEKRLAEIREKYAEPTPTLTPEKPKRRKRRKHKRASKS
ncbi:MAG: C/D box methylation guide ribonucleoprotein complex aNOP56 subunit [Candidatus Bathyarchaeia archaeon]